MLFAFTATVAGCLILATAIVLMAAHVKVGLTETRLIIASRNLWWTASLVLIYPVIAHTVNKETGLAIVSTVTLAAAIGGAVIAAKTAGLARRLSSLRRVDASRCSMKA